MSQLELYPENEPRARTTHPPTFDEWYARYPKKQGKAKARERWSKMSAAERVSAWNALDGWVRYAAEHPRGNTFVPMASTWLNQCRWEDDAPRVERPEPVLSRSTTALRNAMERRMRDGR